MRKDKLHVSHGLGWTIVAVAFTLLGFVPSLFDKFSAFLGIASPPILALTLAIAILVIKILLMDIERSRIELRNQRLIQRLAMLEAEMRSKSRKENTASNEQRLNSGTKNQ
ncbi:hypothetical protein GPB2148_2228 [marine gamma proteobacterium HTCC2148]|nr:hypothetical protein GPB2148_2228 [marine gamma proteobacterium HTCC2148]